MGLRRLAACDYVQGSPLNCRSQAIVAALEPAPKKKSRGCRLL